MLTKFSTGKYAVLTVCNYDNFADEKISIDQIIDQQPTKLSTKLSTKSYDANDVIEDVEVEEVKPKTETRNTNRPTKSSTKFSTNDKIAEPILSDSISDSMSIDSISANINNNINIPEKEAYKKERCDEKISPLENLSEKETAEYIQNFYNSEVEASSSILPKCVSVAGQRLTHISARVREYGLDTVIATISRAVRSDFLNGKNDRGWRADFGWIFLPNNFLKVAEGRYDNKTINNGNTTGFDKRELERRHRAEEYSKVIQQLLDGSD